MEEEVLKLNENVLCSLKALDKSKAHLFTVNAGDTPKDQTVEYLKRLARNCDEVGVAGIYSAKSNDGTGGLRRQS